MYFHSATSRRDHYASLRNQHQLFKQQQLQQLQRRSSTNSSLVSETDNGCQSSPLSPTSRHSKNDQHRYGTKQDYYDNASTTDSFMTNSTTSTKKKLRATKKHLDHSLRQPDLVYSSPRPLAFPFHNDCHFLPVAEADPRDIARIAPPPPPSSRRVPNTSKTPSLTSSSSYHRTSISSIPEDDSISHTTNNDRPASLISSVQQGTVRSLRSFFQMNGQPQQQQQHTHRPIESDRRLSALEPKLGTVSSLRKLFSRPLPSPPLTNTHHADREAETAINTAKNSQSGNRTKTLSFGKHRAITDHSQLQQKPSPSSSYRFTLPQWTSKTTTDISKPSSTSPDTKKTQSTSLSTGLKRLFTRQTSSAIGSSPSRPFFASFSRAAKKDIDPKTPPKKQHTTTTTTVNDNTLASSPPPSPPTTVGRIWKNFKRLVNGNKVSRIGVL